MDPIVHGFDAYSPREIPARVKDFCVVKARLPLLSLAMHGMLAGAFIGLGAMGGPMAQNLVKHGFSLVVHDIDPAKADLWRARGATVVGSAAEVAARVERTISMVETTAQAEAVVAGEQGIMHTARPGHIVISMSTIDPLAARRLAERLAAKGVAMLDAPVSGGTERAASGELSIIVGGAPETVAACQDLFRAMGARVFHMGGLGQGLAMKLINNMLVQVNTVAVAAEMATTAPTDRSTPPVAMTIVMPIPSNIRIAPRFRMSIRKPDRWPSFTSIW